MTNEEMFQNIESFTVGLDDTFSFHCTQCGKCCIHRTDIILSPRDIFKMAKELKLSNADFLRKYCSMHIGPTSRIPVITLRPVGKDDRCPLLKNNKCSVHKVKPSVCGMFPLGRYIAFGKDDFGKKELNCGEVKYLLQPIECGDKSETHTVRDSAFRFTDFARDPYELENLAKTGGEEELARSLQAAALRWHRETPRLQAD